jgi:UDP-glucose 4-epimerase
VFNVTGAGEVPISVLVREAGGTKVPLPETLVQVLLGRLGFPNAGGGVVEFLKNPCLVDGARFAAATGFVPEHDLVATVRSVRAPSLS